MQCRRPQVNSWVEKILWRRDGLPTPVFRPGEFQGLAKNWKQLSDFDTDMKERIEIGWQEERRESKPDYRFFKNWKKFESVEMLFGKHQ